MDWLVMTGVALLAAGCPFASSIPPAGDGLADDPAGSDEPQARTVLVYFRNLAVEEAVDVQFYVSNDPSIALSANLFLEHNALSAGIGIAGTGILEPLREDTVEVPCTEYLSLGTSGGSFLDNESGELRGTGMPRWVQHASVGLCGRRILIEYVSEFDTYTTRISVGG